MSGYEKELLDRYCLYIGKIPRQLLNLSNRLIDIGIRTHQCPASNIADIMIGKYHYSLVIIWQMHNKNTVNICQKIRNNSNYPIIIALLNKTNIELEEQLFSNGVNDVVSGRHITENIILARIRNHLSSRNRLPDATEIYHIGNIIIDFKQQQIDHNGLKKDIKGTACQLLKYFIENSDRIVTRKELFHSYIWDDSICTDPIEGGKTIDVTVSKLRNIIEINPSKPTVIESVRGLGWRFKTTALEKF